MAVPSRLASLKPSWVDEFRAFIMRRKFQFFR
jgi:hypothetical protein